MDFTPFPGNTNNIPLDLPTSPNTTSESEYDENLSSKQSSVHKDHGNGVESLTVEPTISLSSTDDLDEMQEAAALTSFGQKFPVISNVRDKNVSLIGADSLRAPINSGE